MPCSTLRAWLLGIICSIIFPGLNQFLFFRYPTVVVGPVCHNLSPCKQPFVSLCTPSRPRLSSPPLCRYMTSKAGRSTAIIPRGSIMGSHSPTENRLRHIAKPRAVYAQRTRLDYDHGRSGEQVCIRGECWGNHHGLRTR